MRLIGRSNREDDSEAAPPDSAVSGNAEVAKTAPAAWMKSRRSIHVLNGSHGIIARMSVSRRSSRCQQVRMASHSQHRSRVDSQCLVAPAWAGEAEQDPRLYRHQHSSERIERGIVVCGLSGSDLGTIACWSATGSTLKQQPSGSIAQSPVIPDLTAPTPPSQPPPLTPSTIPPRPPI